MDLQLLSKRAIEHHWQTTSITRAGLAVIGTIGVLSTTSTLLLLLYFLYCYLRSRFSPPRSNTGQSHLAVHHGISEFIRGALGRYLVYIILCDFLQGLAFCINLNWAVMGGIREGIACTTQGVLDQIGGAGTGLWSLLLAFQTFCLLFLQTRPPKYIEVCATIFIWGALITLPIIGPYAIEETAKGPFFSDSGLWCWIGDSYKDTRFPFLYVWILLTLACCLVMYSLIYLKFAGMTNGISFSSQTNAIDRRFAGKASQELVGFRYRVKIARRLMWYPLVYAIVIIPVSICRIGVLAHWQPPLGYYIFAGVCYASSGLSNTLLFIFTRHSFIQQRSRGVSGRLEVTINVTRTSDYPASPPRSMHKHRPHSGGGVSDFTPELKAKAEKAVTCFEMLGVEGHPVEAKSIASSYSCAESAQEDWSIEEMLSEGYSRNQTFSHKNTSHVL